MNQKFDFHLFSQQLDDLLERSNNSFAETDPHIHSHYPMEPGFSDLVALETFVSSLYIAFDTDNPHSIKNALRNVISIEKTPQFNHAIQAYTSSSYEAALYAAETAYQNVLDDTSMNRHFAYIAICFLMAYANEKLGNDTAVIQIILRCQQRLELELGNEAADWFKDIHERLQPRWGHERFQDALFQLRKQAFII